MLEGLGLVSIAILTKSLTTTSLSLYCIYDATWWSYFSDIYPNKTFNVSSYLEACSELMMKTLPSRFSFTPLNISLWVVTDSFLLLRLSRPGFCPPIEEPTSVEICPVDTVPSPLELRSILVEIYPMLFVISADDSIIQKIKNSKICQPQERSGWNIIHI